MITTWEKKWLTTPSGECYSPMMSRYRLSFDHAHGVFILIIVGSLFAVLVLIFEWLVYKFVVPCLKQHEYSGKWKYILFFSQVTTVFSSISHCVTPVEKLLKFCKKNCKMFQKPLQKLAKNMDDDSKNLQKFKAKGILRSLFTIAY